MTVTRPGRPLARLAAALVTLALVAGCAAAPPSGSPPAAIEGRVSWQGRGFAGAEVLLLPTRWDPARDPEPVARARSGPGGSFALSPPPGVYLVLARTPGKFAYFGRNPVRLRARLSGLNLPLVPVHPVTRLAARPGEERIEGRVLAGGRPLAGARVFAYLDTAQGLRGPGYALSDPSGPDGSFLLPLPPGTYFVAARLRKGGLRGALHPGDRFGVLPRFPLRISRGEAIRADIETVEIPSADRMARFRGDFARLTGRIVDRRDRPVAGMRACLYANPQMLDRPAAVAEPSGADGSFVLTTSLAGTFFLGAREVLGGPPEPGERVGFYRGPRGTAVDVRPGERIEGLRIVVMGVP